MSELSGSARSKEATGYLCAEVVGQTRETQEQMASRARETTRLLESMLNIPHTPVDLKQQSPDFGHQGPVLWNTVFHRFCRGELGWSEDNSKKHASKIPHMHASQ